MYGICVSEYDGLGNWTGNVFFVCWDWIVVYEFGVVEFDCVYQVGCVDWVAVEEEEEVGITGMLLCGRKGKGMVVHTGRNHVYEQILSVS